MPFVAAAGALFATIGSVATVVSGIAGIGAALAATLATVGTVLTIAGAVLSIGAMLFMKKPKPASQEDEGQQLRLKVDPQAPTPILFGRAATGGFLIARDTYGAKNANLAMLVALSVGGPIEGIESVKLGDFPVGFSGNPNTTLAPVNTVQGSPDSKLYKTKYKTRYFSGGIMTNSVGGTAGVPIFNRSTDRISGIAATLAILEYNAEAFPQGQPEAEYVAKGVKCYDPRKDDTYTGGAGTHRYENTSTYTYSDNPFICALNWTLGRFENGVRVFGIGAPKAEVDIAAFVAGANVADANG